MPKIVRATVKNVAHWFNKLAAFPPTHVFEFDPAITWIIGENGSGKSSLLALLNKYDESKGKDDYPLELEITGGRGSISFFDTERMNPRMLRGFAQEATAFNFQVAVIMSKASHGQTLFPILMAATREAQFKNAVVLNDEPESGISPWNQKKLLDAWTKAAAERGTQFIFATHSPIFIESGAGSVLDLTGGPARLVPSTEFKLFT